MCLFLFFRKIHGLFLFISFLKLFLNCKTHWIFNLFPFQEPFQKQKIHWIFNPFFESYKLKIQKKLNCQSSPFLGILFQSKNSSDFYSFPPRRYFKRLKKLKTYGILILSFYDFLKNLWVFTQKKKKKPLRNLFWVF